MLRYLLRPSDKPSWSRDGSQIAFLRYDLHLYSPLRWNRHPVDSTANCRGSHLSNRRRLTVDRAQDFNAVWSPRGTHIAFVRDWALGDWDRSPHTGVYVMAADGSDLRRVAAFYEVVLTEPRNETVFVNTDIEAGPTWSPDGQVLAFAVVEFERVPDEHEASLSDEIRHNVLYSVRPDGSNLTRLLDMPEGSTVETLGWSPDGKIAITYKYRDRASYTVYPDGSDLVQQPYINLS